MVHDLLLQQGCIELPVAVVKKCHRVAQVCNGSVLNNNMPCLGIRIVFFMNCLGNLSHLPHTHLDNLATPKSLPAGFLEDRYEMEQ